MLVGSVLVTLSACGGPAEDRAKPKRIVDMLNAARRGSIYAHKLLVGFSDDRAQSDLARRAETASSTLGVTIAPHRMWRFRGSAKGARLVLTDRNGEDATIEVRSLMSATTAAASATLSLASDEAVTRWSWDTSAPGAP